MTTDGGGRRKVFKYVSAGSVSGSGMDDPSTESPPRRWAQEHRYVNMETFSAPASAG